MKSKPTTVCYKLPCVKLGVVGKTGWVCMVVSKVINLGDFRHCWVGSGLVCSELHPLSCLHVCMCCDTDSPLTVIKNPPTNFPLPACRDDMGVLFSSTLSDSSRHHHTVYSSLHKGVASSHGGKTQTFRPPPPYSPPLCSKIELWLFFFSRMIGLTPTRS